MIYGYTRVSTQKQKDGTSLEEQKMLILSTYPNANIVVDVYSGMKKRPNLEELIKIVGNGDVIVCTKLDRFCRSTREGLDYIQKIQKRGCSIHILNMGLIDNTSIGKLMVTMMLGFAEFERNMIVERTQAGKERAKKKAGFKDGRPVRKVPNFSYYYDRVQEGKISVRKALKSLNISSRKWYTLVREKQERMQKLEDTSSDIQIVVE